MFAPSTVTANNRIGTGSRAAAGIDPGAARDAIVAGTLELIKFHRDGFLIGRVREAVTDRVVSVKGSCMQPQIGATYRMAGTWNCHPQYGDTFAFSTYSLELPVEANAIVSYLMATAKWIGPHVGRAIVDQYGASTMHVLKQDPERVVQDVRGITMARALEIQAMLQENERMERVTIQLNGLLTGTGMGAATVRKALDKWKHEAIAVLTANPFELCALRGIGFLLADRVRAKLGVSPEDPFRIESGILHALNEAANGSGHCYLTEVEFKKDTQALLTLPFEVIAQVLDGMNDVSLATDGVTTFAMGELHDAEQTIAHHLVAMVSRGAFPVRSQDVDTSSLADDQKDAVSRLLPARVGVLTGSPGTGKTFTIKRLMRMLPPGRVALAAPTGKAALRIHEQTGVRATTIHRLLEAKPDSSSNSGFEFARNADNPLEYETIIVDEMSMTCCRLMASLVRAIPFTSRLILIGDTNQLPSVGPGNVLRDIISSGVVATAELRTIKRQDPGLLLSNLHRIRDGNDIVVDNEHSQDFFWQDEPDAEKAATAIVELLTRRLPSFRGGFDPLKDIQVLSPLRERGTLSCATLNERLQAALNPNKPVANQLGNRHFAIGDKVIQTANDYGIGVFNGEIGIMVDIDSAARIYTVRFDSIDDSGGIGPERLVNVKWDEADLALAYAITVHRSQGSEWPIVVMPIHRSQGPTIMTRNLLYTAISRAKTIFVGVGQQSEVPRIIKRQSQCARNTKLEQFLKEAVAG